MFFKWTTTVIQWPLRFPLPLLTYFLIAFSLILFVFIDFMPYHYLLVLFFIILNYWSLLVNFFSIEQFFTHCLLYFTLLPFCAIIEHTYCTTITHKIKASVSRQPARQIDRSINVYYTLFLCKSTAYAIRYG